MHVYWPLWAAATDSMVNMLDLGPTFKVAMPIMDECF